MIDGIGKDFEFYQKALTLRQQRQEVLATNIANADTPNYKARDIDFSATLRQAMGQGGGLPRLPDTSLTLTSPRHIPAKAHTAAPGQELYRVPLQPSLDGNTVDMNVERVQFADNTTRYQTDIQVLNQRIKSMLSALQ
ncbi:MAG: flagellar basal body rod protein FlgB [Castellaniella sp.]|uniref:flagellar basal body rod protein FlgB n=1 Tax=Castellaniella sp. TaxID=1955812 RepID=UPI001225909A|nr:flagellar basal body rod protein FlgB [Castellaniella sp.]TAN27709.1 MAG: flagellar basal body rod protein FlgB [Castellaniella sp.]